MIVVDTNIIAYLYLPGEQTELAERAFLKDPQWASPVLWRSEFRNVLAYYAHQSVISLEDALRIAEEAEALMYGREYEIVSAEVLSLAASSGCAAYDCEFVALAKDLNVSLVTADRKILSAFPNKAIALGDFVR